MVERGSGKILITFIDCRAGTIAAARRVLGDRGF
jgi:hypothetical protein